MSAAAYSSWIIDGWYLIQAKHEARSMCLPIQVEFGLDVLKHTRLPTGSIYTIPIELWREIPPHLFFQEEPGLERCHHKPARLTVDAAASWLVPTSFGFSHNINNMTQQLG